MKIIVSEKHPWYGKQSVTEEEIARENMLVYKNRPAEGHESFLYNMKVEKRIPVQNVDTYMGILREGGAFGIVGDIYSRREGKFKLIPLPESCNVKAQVIGAYKNLHPNAKLLQGLRNMNFELENE